MLDAAPGIDYVVRTGLKGDALREALMQFDGAICRSGVKITAEALDGNRRLKAIVRAGVGTDNIDKEAATRLGIVVMNTPTGNTLSTAEHAFTLMLDSTWAYDYPAAIRVGRAIERLGYYWYEDPLADDDLYNYVKLKQHLSIPILATEYSPGGFTAYAPWLVARATDFLRGDVAVKGGISALVKAAHLAEGFHMNFEIHHGGNSLNNVANLHVAMAIRNCEFFEVLLPAEAQKYGLVADIEVDSHGMVRAPTAPGLGAPIDFDLIERKTLAVLR